MIEWIRLQNCQSWVDGVLHLTTNRLNVIVGNNNAGKSVLFKILKLAGNAHYYDKTDRVDLIRRGCKYAKTTFKFTDGSFAVMQIGKDQVLYAFLATSDSSLVAHTEPPQEMVEHIGLLASKDESFVANIVDTEQGLLLIDPRLQSNYDLMAMIATCEKLDVVKVRTDDLIKEYRDKLVRAVDKENYVEQQLRSCQFQDAEGMRSAREQVSGILPVMDVAAQCLDEAFSIHNLCEKRGNFEYWLGVLDFVEKLQGVHLEVSRPPLDLDFISALEQIEAVEHWLSGITLIGSPVDLQFIAALEIAEKVCSLFSEITIPFNPGLDLVEIIKILSLAEEAVDLVECTAEPIDLELIAALEIVERVSKSCFQVPDRSELTNLEQRFLQKGKFVDCPIWGEVIFDGKDCVASSF